VSQGPYVYCVTFKIKNSLQTEHGLVSFSIQEQPCSVCARFLTIYEQIRLFFIFCNAAMLLVIASPCGLNPIFWTTLHVGRANLRDEEIYVLAVLSNHYMLYNENLNKIIVYFPWNCFWFQIMHTHTVEHVSCSFLSWGKECSDSFTWAKFPLNKWDIPRRM
jgi:hypothetical protein